MRPKVPRTCLALPLGNPGPLEGHGSDGLSSQHRLALVVSQRVCGELKKPSPVYRWPIAQPAPRGKANIEYCLENKILQMAV